MEREISDLLTRIDQYNQTHPTISILLGTIFKRKNGELKNSNERMSRSSCADAGRTRSYTQHGYALILSSKFRDR